MSPTGGVCVDPEFAKKSTRGYFVVFALISSRQTMQYYCLCSVWSVCIVPVGISALPRKVPSWVYPVGIPSWVNFLKRYLCTVCTRGYFSWQNGHGWKQRNINKRSSIALFAFVGTFLGKVRTGANSAKYPWVLFLANSGSTRTPIIKFNC